MLLMVGPLPVPPQVIFDTGRRDRRRPLSNTVKGTKVAER